MRNPKPKEAVASLNGATHSLSVNLHENAEMFKHAGKHTLSTMASKMNLQGHSRSKGKHILCVGVEISPKLSEEPH